MKGRIVKLVVLGANGRTGQHVLEAALEKGMDVTAVVRSVDRTPVVRHDRLTVEIGDPCDPSFLKRVFRDHDAVISTLGGRLPTRTASSVYYRSAQAIVEAAQDTGLDRVVVTSTALLFPEQPLMGRLLRLLVPNIVRSAARMEATLKNSGLGWTTVRPGFLSDAEILTYSARKDRAPKEGTSVSRRALARFLVDAVGDPNTRYATFGIGNGAE